MNWKNWLTVGGSAFLGAAVGSLETDTGTVFLSMATAKPALITAALAGVVAVVHLYQPKPGAVS